MGKHRSRLKILASILEVVAENNGAKKTQIMYQAYLSCKLLVQYLNDVTEAGFVVCGEDSCYKLTPKGEKFLAKFKEYAKSRATINRKLNHVEKQKSILEEMSSNREAINA